ncbi:uncharacterized protein LOC131163039 isoform X2 [Malania oleifera]|uniref:uncharacterized protein LOC131163039 isoform X2 n=1 Tax=Malania oleifera TaxID=397392 RepID=UPI0025AE63D8|nr:uncharacterized protein LOC131163039 isoform X2 [Malania oleifera]
MGSLMAGWDSPVRDPKLTYQRNSSLTRGEIDAYWKSKKKTEEEHLRAISASSDCSPESTPDKYFERILQRSSSLPSSNYTKKDIFMEMDETGTSLERLVKKNGWWTKSSLAFLNEPPVIASAEGTSHKYASQFHVAGKSESFSGISA